MDNPANPVFFNTFDPFDAPAPPNHNVNKPASSSLPNYEAAGTAHPDVNSFKVLRPSSTDPSNNNNASYFIPSPLDSPSINPYPLPPRSDSQSSFTSPTPAAQPPVYNNTPSSSLSNSYTAPLTSSSSVPKSSPMGSPSLMSSQGSYPQLQASSPTPQGQYIAPQFQPPSHSPIHMSQPQSQPQQSMPLPMYPQQLPQQPSIPQQPPHQSPPPQPQPSQPPQPIQPPQPARSQSPAPTPFQQSSSPSFTTQSNNILEQINKSITTVMTRLDSIENRISFLEITTKEVLNNQRTISTQQRKLQDSVDTTAKMPTPVPMPQQHVYEEPRKAAAPVYQPPMPSHVTHTPGPVIMPPPMSHHPHMPALVPVTHIPNRGEMDYKLSSSVPSSRSGSQYDADLELAKKLQAEFDASSSSSTTSSSSNSNTSSSASSYASKPYQSSSSASSSSSSSQPKSGQQECPICQTRIAIADLEAHVEQHFEDEEAKRAPLKPGEKPRDKNEAKAGFFAKLFGPKPEDEKKPASTETPAPAPTPAPAANAQVPYTHTMSPAAYNQRMGYYPNMAASPGRAMYPSYYGYPMQNVPRTAQPQQQYLYYPNLDQAPQ